MYENSFLLGKSAGQVLKTVLALFGALISILLTPYDSSGGPKFRCENANLELSHGMVISISFSLNHKPNSGYKTVCPWNMEQLYYY